jgi:hypothetical protein
LGWEGRFSSPKKVDRSNVIVGKLTPDHRAVNLTARRN